MSAQFIRVIPETLVVRWRTSAWSRIMLMCLLREARGREAIFSCLPRFLRERLFRRLKSWEIMVDAAADLPSRKRKSQCQPLQPSRRDLVVGPQAPRASQLSRRRKAAVAAGDCRYRDYSYQGYLEYLRQPSLHSCREGFFV